MSSIRSLVLGLGLMGGSTLAVAQPEPSLDATLAQAQPGQLVIVPQLNLGEKNIATIPVTRHDAGGPQFLISDKPEYFRTGNGISLRERVEPGVVRLYLYHVPEPTGEKKVITAVIDNLGEGPMSFRFTRYAFPKPSGNYRQIGKNALVSYFEGDAPSDVRTLDKGGRMVIDPALEKVTVIKDQLVHTFHEFEIDQPALIRVFQRDPDADSLKVVDELPELPQVLPGWHPSGAGRGLFTQSEFNVSPTDTSYVYDTAEGPRQIIVADGKTDPWITGRDSITGITDAPNKGNYGTVYHIRMPFRSTDGRAVALMAYNARGGAKGCSTQAVALKVNAGRYPEGIVLAPKDQVNYGPAPDAVLLQLYPTPTDASGGVIDITYSPPGASCLPVGLVLVPINLP